MVVHLNISGRCVVQGMLWCRGLFPHAAFSPHNLHTYVQSLAVFAHPLCTRLSSTTIKTVGTLSTVCSAMLQPSGFVVYWLDLSTEARSERCVQR